MGRAVRYRLLTLADALLHPARRPADDESGPSRTEAPLLLGGSTGLMWEEILDPPFLLAFSIVVVVLGIARWQWSHMHGRFFTVVEGQLFRSGAIRPDRLRRKVQRHGIRAVIDLRSARPAVDREREALEEIGVKHFHLPSKQVPRAETIDAVLELLDQEDNRPALVHCNHGVRRAAQFEAICRMEYQRWSNDRALSVLRRRSAFLGFRPGSRPHRFVQGYVPRRERAAVAQSS
jgi:protein tyrosine phosphatase (PTP) superfamily phosphohydrolase (DUF442 family)